MKFLNNQNSRKTDHRNDKQGQIDRQASQIIWSPLPIMGSISVNTKQFIGLMIPSPFLYKRGFKKSKLRNNKLSKDDPNQNQQLNKTNPI